MKAQLFIGTLVLLCTSGCYKEEDFDTLALDPSDVIRSITSDRSSLLANNADIAEIAVELPEDGREGLDVVFRTDKGVFLESNAATITVKTKVVLQDNGGPRIVAIAKLRNGLSTGTITVRAAIGAYEVDVLITSVDNPPTELELSASTLALSNDPEAEVELTAQLRAASGTVTKGHVVALQVLNSSMNPIGHFRVVENESNADGKCRFIYSLVPDSTYVGDLHIQASTQGPSGSVNATMTIYATN